MTPSESEKHDTTFKGTGVNERVRSRDKVARANQRDVLGTVVQGAASNAMIEAYYGDCDSFCVLFVLTICCVGGDSEAVKLDKRKLEEHMTFIAVMSAQRILKSAHKDEGKCKALTHSFTCLLPD